MTDIEHTMTITTTVRHKFTGLSYGVAEWPGFSYTGKPALITNVSISHHVDERGVADPEVHVAAYSLKKDGTPMAVPMDTRFSLSRYKGSREYPLRTALIEEYGADVAVEAQAVWQKLYG